MEYSKRKRKRQSCLEMSLQGPFSTQSATIQRAPTMCASGTGLVSRDTVELDLGPAPMDWRSSCREPDSKPAIKNNYSSGEYNQRKKTDAVINSGTGGMREAVHSNQGGPLSWVLKDDKEATMPRSRGKAVQVMRTAGVNAPKQDKACFEN